jgi:hypothetical protein
LWIISGSACTMFFGAVDVAQRMHEQVVHCLDVFREEAHDVQPFLVPRSASAISFVATALSTGNVQRGPGVPGDLREAMLPILELGTKTRPHPNHPLATDW